MIKQHPRSDIPCAGALFACVVALVGLAGAIAIYRQPEGLQVPLWLALTACFSFLLSGIALSLKTTRYRRLFHWTVVLLLLCMGAIPAWLTLGSGASTCTASPPVISSILGCRFVFGVSTAVILLFLLLAIKDAIRRPAV